MPQEHISKGGIIGTSSTALRTNKKAPLLWSGAKLMIYMGWLMGLEPTTTGITILDSTNWATATARRDYKRSRASGKLGIQARSPHAYSSRSGLQNQISVLIRARKVLNICGPWITCDSAERNVCTRCPPENRLQTETFFTVTLITQITLEISNTHITNTSKSNRGSHLSKL